jgi:pimeloyl-ACP methyl ester carboxylesterase
MRAGDGEQILVAWTAVRRPSAAHSDSDDARPHQRTGGVMATYVLVHGAWVSAWYWQRVTPLLRQAGHTVFAPTFTGMGERSHLLNRDITLDTFVKDIEQVLFYEDLTDVILVGHSFGGTVITAVAERASERIAQLIYLDAEVPRSGESDAGCLLPGTVEFVLQRAREHGDGWLFTTSPSATFGVTDPDDQAWIDARLTPQPVVTVTQPIYYGEAVEALPRHFVACRPYEPLIADIRARIQQDPSWTYQEIDGGHLVMITRPHDLAECLLTFAAIPN